MTESNDVNQAALAQIQAGNALPSEKKFYVNGFVIAVSPADIVVICQQNGEPVAMLSMSYVLAKTFMERLKTSLEDLETKMGQPILTVDAITASLGLRNTNE